MSTGYTFEKLSVRLSFLITVNIIIPSILVCSTRISNECNDYYLFAYGQISNNLCQTRSCDTPRMLLLINRFQMVRGRKPKMFRRVYRTLRCSFGRVRSRRKILHNIDLIRLIRTNVTQAIGT